MTAVHPDHGILFVQIHQLLLCTHPFKSSDICKLGPRMFQIISKTWTTLLQLLLLIPQISWKSTDNFLSYSESENKKIGTKALPC